MADIAHHAPAFDAGVFFPRPASFEWTSATVDTATAPLLARSAARSQAWDPEWEAVFGPPRLTEAERQALGLLLRPRQLAVGELVFRRGQAASQLVAVLDGAVGLGVAGEGQAFHLERNIHGPAWLDISSAWVGGGHVQDARVLLNATVLELPLEGLRQLLGRFPDLRERMMRALAQAVQNLTGATHDLMAKDAQKRLATWLLSQRSDACGGDVALKERKRELAAQLAITPETLSRLLRGLMSAGLIEVKGYSIKLLNLGALQTLAHD
ncbi:Crp/Fnr family transcriptional regulator [Paucibacter sp. AS339]|uniref:Crp/Fnr family transcriptional regulator n=1 Tax=Paucibacter hankyongi TaxID=3133434 RepID=UPI0030B5E0EF